MATSHNGEDVVSPADVARVIAYLNSEEGRTALAKHNAELDALYKKLAAMRVIPQELLHAPFTI